MMFKSQFKKKKDPCDWFCGPGSHITCQLRKTEGMTIEFTIAHLSYCHMYKQSVFRSVPVT